MKKLFNKKTIIILSILLVLVLLAVFLFLGPLKIENKKVENKPKTEEKVKKNEKKKEEKEEIKKEEKKEEQVEEQIIVEQPVEQYVEQPVYVNPEYSTGIPVLNYHFFYEDEIGGCNERICLARSKFEEQLKYLVDNGFKTLTMQEFIDWYEGRIEVPYKAVLLTIDDGAMGTSFINGNILIPLLEKYQVNATLFLITAWWDKANYQSEYLDVESHGYDIHWSGNCGAGYQIKCLDHNQLYNDLKQSMDILGSYKSFCYPFYVATSDSYSVLQELGVKVAFGGGGYNASRNSYRYQIPRYPIYDSITMDEFIRMIS